MEQYKLPCFFALISAGTIFEGASLKPSGNIITAPTFKPPFYHLLKLALSLDHKEF